MLASERSMPLCAVAKRIPIIGNSFLVVLPSPAVGWGCHTAGTEAPGHPTPAAQPPRGRLSASLPSWDVGRSSRRCQHRPPRSPVRSLHHTLAVWGKRHVRSCSAPSPRCFPGMPAGFSQLWCVSLQRLRRMSHESSLARSLLISATDTHWLIIV